jgi:hypothetical protein
MRCVAADGSSRSDPAAARAALCGSGTATLGKMTAPSPGLIRLALRKAQSLRYVALVGSALQSLRSAEFASITATRTELGIDRSDSPGAAWRGARLSYMETQAPTKAGAS